MRAAIYCRISRDPTGGELGVKRQEADCRALCEHEGFDVVEVFIDDDRSAYSGKPRPAFKRLTDLLKTGTVDVLVAWHPDRITRQPRELEDLIDLLEATSTTVRTVQTGEYDLSTPSGRMSARIVGAVARHESEHKSARLRRKHLELAEAGQLAGGGPDRPFGYEEDRVTVRESEAEVLRDVVARFLGGETIWSLSKSLNEQGVRTSAGNEWKPSTLRDTLSRARIAGLRSHRGEVVTEAVWPAIIDPDDYYRVKAMLSDPARRKNNGARRKLLTGLLVCGRCGTAMVSRPRADKTPTYVCAKTPGTDGCGKMRIVGEPLDDLVTDAVLYRLDSLVVAEAMAEADRDDRPILDELRRLDERRDELAEMWAAGEVSRSEWQAATRALDKRGADLESELAEVTTSAAVAADVTASGGIRKVWPELDHERRRAVLAAVIESIEIAPAVRGRNKFDADRVSVRWKA